MCFSAQIVTTLTQNFDNVLTFPAVTICNFNKVHCRNLYDRIRELNNSDDESDEMNYRIQSLCTVYNVGLCEYKINADDMFKHGEKRAETICVNIYL